MLYNRNKEMAGWNGKPAALGLLYLLFEFAENMGEVMGTKKLVLVTGYPATGKNYISDTIGTQMGHLAYFDKDDLFALVDAAFAISGEEHNRDSGFYIQNIRPAEYQTIVNMALSALRYEDVALINAPFLSELRDAAYMKSLKQKVNAQNIQLVVVWTHSSLELIRERMVKRNASRDKWKLENWEEYTKTINLSPPLALVENALVDELFVVDTTDDNSIQKGIRGLLDMT